MVELEAAPEVQVLGDAVLIRGLAALETYRILGPSVARTAAVDAIAPNPRVRLIMAGVKAAAETVAAQRKSDIADTSDVRDQPSTAQLRTGEVIGLADVARMLGLGERQARRRATELGGWRTSPRSPWKFDRGLVTTYMNAGGTTR